MKTEVIWKTFAACGLVAGVCIGESSHAASAQPLPPARACVTSTVLVTLAGEQVSFCAPSTTRFSVAEDSASDQFSSYAALNQASGYAYVNVKSTFPGHAPGIGRPIYQAGGIESYRQSILNSESAKPDRKINAGPSGVFWGEAVTGLALDMALTAGSNNVQMTSVEWNIEHGGRLWTFVIAWDSRLANGGEWRAAVQGFVVSKPAAQGLPDTALDLGKSRSTSGAQIQAAPVDVGTPSWWSGTCNDSNYYPAMGLHAVPLGSSWHNVLACGPRPSYTSGNPDHFVQFYNGSWGAYEFECVELVLRFLYLEWGVAPFPGNGNSLKDYMPASMTFLPNGYHSIVPGDAITENGSQVNSFGHTAIVTAVNLDSTGTGTITILEQNASSTGSRSLSVTGWTISPDFSGIYQQTIQGWMHVNANPLHKDSVGVFRSGTFYLRSGSGSSDIIVAFNPATKAYPVVGDWTGIGIDSIGVYDQANGLFSLRNTNTGGAPDEQLVLGVPNDQPMVGRWALSLAHDGVGIFRPSNGLIYLRNTLTTGYADETMVLGIPGDIGIAGDWTNKGFSSPGVYRPSNSTMYLSNQVCNCAVYANITFTYGAGSNLRPIVGDWTASGHVGVGLFTSGMFNLRNTLTSGTADITWAYGLTGDLPLAGHWIGGTGSVAKITAVDGAIPGSAPTQSSSTANLGD